MSVQHTTKIRIRATDRHKNVMYIWRNEGEYSWHAALANGTSYQLPTDVRTGDVMALTFALEDAATVEDALIALETYGSSLYTYTPV